MCMHMRHTTDTGTRSLTKYNTIPRRLTRRRCQETEQSHARMPALANLPDLQHRPKTAQTKPREIVARRTNRVGLTYMRTMSSVDRVNSRCEAAHCKRRRGETSDHGRPPHMCMVVTSADVCTAWRKQDFERKHRRDIGWLGKSIAEAWLATWLKPPTMSDGRGGKYALAPKHHTYCRVVHHRLPAQG